MSSQEEGKYLCLFSSFVRSQAIHRMSYLKRFVQWVCSWLPWTDDNGTLLKEEGGRITATGVEDNNHTEFWVYARSDRARLTFKIQSKDGKYLAIDEGGQLVVKDLTDEDDISVKFQVLDAKNPKYIVLRSMLNGAYLSVDADMGTVTAVTAVEEVDFTRDRQTWFTKIKLS